MSFAKILHNSTYATVRAEPLMDRHGADVLTVVAKLALAFDHAGLLGLSARSVRVHDEPDGEGGIRYPTDLVVEKVGTDVGLVGTLIPPERGGLSQINAWLRVGTLGKAVQVFGRRVYMNGATGVVPGPAAPLERVPLIAALAYGGVDETSEPRRAEAHNPAGRGYASDAGRLVGRPAPQIEPAALLDMPSTANVRSLAASRAQAAFAPIPPHWEPRASLGGTEDADWRLTRAPVAPKDFDTRSENWASSGLLSDAPLAGTEAVELGGLRPGTPIRFHLPGFAPKFRSVESGRERVHTTHLDSVLFDIDDSVVELVWRASIPLSLKWARLERVDVLTAQPLAHEIVDRHKMRGTS